MKGLSLKAVNALEKLIDNKFDSIGLNFLGLIPKISREKKIIFSTNRDSITSLFLQALGSRSPNKNEEDTLKVLLRIANGYIEGLRGRTKARVINQIDSYLKDTAQGKIKPNNIHSIFNKEMDKAKNHFKLIANCESNNAVNTGSALQITKVGKSQGEDDPTVFFIVTIDDVTGPEEFVLHLLADRKTPRVWKLSEIGSEYHKKGEWNPKLPGLHPNCFVGNKGVNVLTEQDGYKNIKDIRVGDRVLTHTGKFKAVTNTLEWYDKKYYGKFIKITYKTYKRDGERLVTLKVTPDHEFMTDRGWVKAIDLKSTDKFKQLTTCCATCGIETSVRPKRNHKGGLEGCFCSRSCKAKYQWSLKSHRKNISEKSSKQMKEKWENPTESMLDQVRKMNSVNRKKIDSNEFWAQQPENLSILQKNIAKINQKLQRNKTSKEETVLFDKIKEVFPTAISQHILEKWCVDVFIPELNINIEYDGGGHYLPVYTGKYSMESFLAKQEGRDIYLQKCGYHVLRYSEVPTKSQIKEDVIRMSKNHTDEYGFNNIDIVSVETVKNGKGGYKLYDITVEDDESFVVNGIVSHNCRCKLTYLAKGWGFDESGRIKFKGKGWDELKFQREKYGLPREKKLEKAYKDPKGFWRLEPTDQHNMEHPENPYLSNKFDHKIAHKANNGKMVWKPKHMRFDQQPVTPQDMDKIHRQVWKQYADKNKLVQGSDLRNTLVKLNGQVINDNDRHLYVSGTSGDFNPKHTEIRQRHLINALRGKPGYSIEEIRHPKTNEHTGVRIKAERHPSGKPYETSWSFDGNSLKTEYDGPKRNLK